jgi:hypothetical protein
VLTFIYELPPASAGGQVILKTNGFSRTSIKISIILFALAEI